MKKTTLKAQLDDDTITKLMKQGMAIGNQSPNTIAAMILTEFSKVPATSGAIWEALGRIHEEGTSTPANAEMENGAAALPRSRRVAVVPGMPLAR